jgi:hypothetical protein
MEKFRIKGKGGVFSNFIARQMVLRQKNLPFRVPIEGKSP